MQRNIIEPHITKPIAWAMGIEAGPDDYHVRCTSSPAHTIVYVGTKSRMVELSLTHYSPAVRKTVLFKARARDGVLIRTVWDHTTNEVTRSQKRIDVGEWGYFVPFGLGCVRLSYKRDPDEKDVVINPDVVRERLRRARQMVTAILQR